MKYYSQRKMLQDLLVIMTALAAGEMGGGGDVDQSAFALTCQSTLLVNYTY